MNLSIVIVSLMKGFFFLRARARTHTYIYTQPKFPSLLLDRYVGTINSASPGDEPLRETFYSHSIGVIMQHRSQLISSGEFGEQSNRTLNTTISPVPLETRLHLQNQCQSKLVQSFTSNVPPSEPLLSLVDILTRPLKSYQDKIVEDVSQTGDCSAFRFT